jgi:hypothetical protein
MEATALNNISKSKLSLREPKNALEFSNEALSIPEIKIRREMMTPSVRR